jgi:hypothetical protein
MIVMRMNLFGQLRLYISDDENKPVWPTWAVEDDENKPVWPAWAVGALSEVRGVESYNRGRPSQRSLRGCLNSPSWMSYTSSEHHHSISPTKRRGR